MRELANLAVYLLHPLSAYVNGQTIAIDEAAWQASGGASPACGPGATTSGPRPGIHQATNAEIGRPGRSSARGRMACAGTRLWRFSG